MRRLGLWAFAVALGLLARAERARAGAGDAEEATRLRDASVTDWNEGRYREAASKLRRAAAIYERTPEQFVADLGTVRRALVWNLVKAGDLAATREPFVALLTVYASEPSLRSDVWLAYSALYEAATGASDIAGVQAVLDPVREAALSAQAADIASQVLHDLGSFSSDRGDRSRALGYYERAIEERRSSSDKLGEAWSLNNLANLDLRSDRWKAALGPLLSAQRLVLSEKLGPPALTIARNIEVILAKLGATWTPDAAVTTWLADLAKAGVAAEGPVVIPTDSLVRRAISARVAQSTDEASRLAIARELVETAGKLSGVPPETRADLALVAAELATDNGGAKDSIVWLRNLDIGSGPAAPHVGVRLLVERAHAAKAGGANATDLTGWISAARKTLVELRDRPLRLSSLPVLEASAANAGLADLAKEIAKEAADATRDGADGGRGGSARGAGDKARYQRLGPLDVVFEIRFVEGKIAIRDTLVDAAAVAIDVIWQPVNVTIDGLALTVFGGYVVVKRLDYGGSSITTGSDSGATLEQLETYLPVPGTGALRVHANGAVSYGD